MVDGVYSYLEDEIHALAEEVNILEIRLGVVLLPDPPTDVAVMDSESQLEGLVNNLMHVRSRVANLSGRVAL